jgi:hypothetical protein
MLRAIWALLITSCLSALALGHSKEKKLEPCALLTAADAASIMGVPLRIVDLSKNSCMYGEYRGRGSLIKGGILDLGLSFGVKRYKDMQAADSAWAKDTPTLDPATKNETEALSGIGDKANLFGRGKDGKLTDFAEIHVRKGTLTFSIQILLVPGHQLVNPSAEALITVAKKIADQL